MDLQLLHPHTQKDTLKNPFPKKHKTEKMENINNKENTQPNLSHNISQSQEAKMEIEENIQENLIGSHSTQDSKNIISSHDSNTNLNNINYAYSQIIPNTNPNVLLYEEEKMPEENPISQKEEQESNSQSLVPCPNAYMKKLAEERKKMLQEQEKKIFKYNFSSKEEYISFLGDYFDDIYSNLLEDEKNLKFKPNFEYMNQQQDLNAHFRAILIDWLDEVHHKFKFKEETLYQTIWIIDTYLSLETIVKTKFQLVGTAALMISCKENEIYYPRVSNLIEIVDNAYAKEELIKMEYDILKKLQFNIICPSALDFYNIISKAFKFDLKQYLLGKYFLESCLLDYQLIRYSASVIGISCAYVIMKFFGFPNYKMLYSKDLLHENSPKNIIKEAAREICFFVRNLHNSNLMAVKNKYSLPENLNVAHYCDQE